MNKRILVTLVISIAFMSLVSAQESKVSDPFRGFDEIIEQYLEEWHIPGLAISVFTDTEILYSKGFGFRDIEKKLPVTAETVFAVGSVTKAFNAFSAALLVEEGKLDFDKPVHDFMPEFRLYTENLTNSVTVRDILSHRTGLPGYSSVLYYTGADRHELLRKMRWLEPNFPLRYKFQYNGVFYIVLSSILEHVGGRTWENLLEESVLTPLKMDATYFNFADAGSKENFAFPYRFTDGQFTKQTTDYIDLTGAAGSMFSTVEDLSKWIQMHLKKGTFGGKEIISEEIFKQLITPTMAREYSLTQSKAYGLGWHCLSHRRHDLNEHMGNVSAYTGYVGFLPNEKIGFVLLMNRNYNLIPFVLMREAFDRVLGYSGFDWVEYFKKIEERYFASREHLEKSRAENTTPMLPLKKYAGIYENPAYGKITINLDGDKLVGSYFGQNFEMEHYHFNVFVPNNSMLKNDKLHFVIDRNGDAVGIEISLEPAAPNDILFTRKNRE